MPTKTPVRAEEDPTLANRWSILRPWRWLVRDNDKEQRHSDTYDTDRVTANAMEDEFDLAYRAMVPAPLGWAIMKTNQLEDTCSDNKEFVELKSSLPNFQY